MTVRGDLLPVVNGNFSRVQGRENATERLFTKVKDLSDFFQSNVFEFNDSEQIQ